MSDIIPYIDPKIRKKFERRLDGLIDLINESEPWVVPAYAGRLNYIIAYLVSRLLKRHSPSYALLNEMIGALECCKLEIYRRLVVNYEGQKIEENGDVFND